MKGPKQPKVSGAGVTETGVVRTADGSDLILWHSPVEVPLGDHLVQHFGECTTVMHSPVLGLHTYVFPPNERRPDAWVLCTMGLSGFLMPGPSTLPEEAWEDFTPMRRAELFMYLDSHNYSFFEWWCGEPMADAHSS